MTTKTKKRATAQRRKPAQQKPRCLVHVNPAYAEFYFGDALQPTSRITNGAPGSNSAAVLEGSLATLRKGFNVVVKHFDGSGREISKP